MRSEQRDELLRLLQLRFEANVQRHVGIAWAHVQAKLAGNPEALRTVQEMEATGGEPDVVGRDATTGQFVFVDCSPESPSGRRSCCFDGEALAARKENKPRHSAAELAAAMGIDLLTEAQYRTLQTLGEFDMKTSSWISTPSNIRALGGALFGDRRYDTVFVYHNGAQSYYAARGFRGSVRV